ncbi:MAG: hypothetical protein REI78_01295 [Pedobacter sp.]|nr:hypothetical protein [Pedobacter sp.]MDQ8051624.1 hypothetical protein [Pedobacter sp.]
MKKLILLALVAIASVSYQPAKAQLSVSINIGSRPHYVPAYYDSYYAYAPARRVVYTRPVVYHRPVVVYQPKRYVSYRSYSPSRVYHTSYRRPVYRSYSVKHVNYNGHKFGKGHGRGRH